MAEHTFTYPKTFILESGDSLPELELVYETFGKLNEQRDNVVWVCHAFTGHPNVMNWWDILFGKGKFFDPKDNFIICVNMPGSCYGSTGPKSLNPQSGRAYYHDFPLLTNRDMVRSFDLLRQDLGITRIKVLIGGSMGGQHVLEWAVMKPDLFEFIIPIATNAKHSPWGIAFNEAQRMAIQTDPTWPMALPFSGMNGMRAARAIAMMSYRSYNGFEFKQQEKSNNPIDNFKAASYLNYMGEKIVDRFNAYTYWYLSKAMDSHNLARGRGKMEDILASIKANAIIISLDGDLLFPPEEQLFLSTYIPNSSHYLVPSLFGHDGFLVEKEAIEHILRNNLAKHAKNP
ncbi:MAG: homoserine O-acetyltransferase [Bacteroidia bacterium]|nr:homoserine O-acetyltransferase [Bacteroidia bacterium]